MRSTVKELPVLWSHIPNMLVSYTSAVRVRGGGGGDLWTGRYSDIQTGRYADVYIYRQVDMYRYIGM